MVGASVEEVAVATIIQEKQRGNLDRNQRWARFERADLFEQYSNLSTQGISQRQAAKVLAVHRSTLQAWRAYHDRLDACPAVVAFFHITGCKFQAPQNARRLINVYAINFMP